MSPPLLSITDLSVSFGRPGRRAVDGLSLTVHAGETLALVGESGCGKTATALAVLRLLPAAGRIEGGVIDFEGRDLLALPPAQMRRVRGGRIAMIFQEPMTSLNPVLTVGDQVAEAVMLHRRVRRREALSIAEEAMAAVGLDAPRRLISAYPHELSGGMRQRVMIAMALACEPALLLADEPTTALDVTVQAQILELLRAVRRERGLAILLITHDLGVVARNADAVCVMYAGRGVEYARAGELLRRPLHPYTRGLLRCAPRLGERRARLHTVEEVVGDPREYGALSEAARGGVPWWPGMGPPAEQVRDAAGRDSALLEVDPGHWVACWRTGSIAERPAARPDPGSARSAPGVQ